MEQRREMLENQTEITIPAMMAMRKAMTKQGQVLRYLIAGLFVLGAIWQIGYPLLTGNWDVKALYGGLFCLLIAFFLIGMPLWANRNVFKQVSQQFCNQPDPLIYHYTFQENTLNIKDVGVPDGRELQVPYSDITRFLQDDTYYFLHVKSMNRTYILKRNAFFFGERTNRADAVAFQPKDEVQVMACLQEKLAHCKGIR